MTYRDEETYSLTLRSVRRPTIDALYELKALKGQPICRLVDEILTDYFENDPSMLQLRQEEVRRLAEEFGAKDGMPPICRDAKVSTLPDPES
jgi:hypothetical protein